MFGIRKRTTKLPVEEVVAAKLPYPVDSITGHPVFDEDPDTGLPKLNAGWHWEVKIEASGSWVYLRDYNGELYELNGIYKAAFSTTMKDPETITEADIRKAAFACIQEVPKKLAKKDSVKAAQEKFNGKYPPKTLGA